jgi:hypothetical protein
MIQGGNDMRTFRIAAVGLVLGGSLAAGGAALASSAAPHITHAETMRLAEHHTKSAWVDVDHNRKPSPGDMYIFVGYFSNPSTNKRVGTLDAHCIVSFNDDGLCEGTATLAGRGAVVVAGGMGGESSDVDLAVTGGTGDFQNARGEVHIHQINDNNSIDTLYLIP